MRPLHRAPARHAGRMVLALLGLALLTGAPAAQAPALVEVPTTTADGWQVLAYRGIPAHEVSFAPDGLTITVQASAAPLVYPLPAPTDAVAIEVAGRLTGGLTLPPELQGQEGYDDYALRAGVVLTGSRRPSWLERLFAPAWVDRLYALAPEGGGISEVRFFNLAVSPGHIGATRRHPLNDLLAEEVVAVPDLDGGFAFRGSLTTDERVVAIWLSADGDDTDSAYSIRVERLVLVPPGT